MAERTSVAIIGAGIAGIAMAEALLSAGRRDFLLIEAGATPGGVWRDTRYPGVACDVPSHVFSYSFAGNPGWSRRYAPGSEVNAYLGDVFNGLGLGARTRFGTRVTACAWGSDRWLLRTSDGAVIEADHVVLATGILRDPLWPAFARGTDFAGQVVHSAEWPEALDLTGQRVAVVGSGSSACQIIPNVVREAASCTVYMRTPPWVMPTTNGAAPALPRRAFEAWPKLYDLYRRGVTEGLLHTYAEHFLGRSPVTSGILSMTTRRALGSVKDPDLRARLTPDYRLGCKRLVFSDALYPALQAPGVEVVRSDIAALTAEGIETTDGVVRGADTVILATGYHVERFHQPMALTGPDGRTLEALWADGPVAHRGVGVPDFPNLHFVLGPGSPIANVSSIEVAEWQARYIVQLIGLAGSGPLALTQAAFEAGQRLAEKAAVRSVWASGGCSSWYRTGDRFILSAERPRHFRRALRAPDPSEYDRLSAA